MNGRYVVSLVNECTMGEDTISDRLKQKLLGSKFDIAF
ncbi:MAG: hypothetical protein JWR54_3275 [Mucilaginibacter sp.]|nr:hypothetical protein [Mucilaginibacter sp.]